MKQPGHLPTGHEWEDKHPSPTSRGFASVAVLEQLPLQINSVFTSGFDSSAGTLKAVLAVMTLSIHFTVFSKGIGSLCWLI